MSFLKLIITSRRIVCLTKQCSGSKWRGALTATLTNRFVSTSRLSRNDNKNNKEWSSSSIDQEFESKIKEASRLEQKKQLFYNGWWSDWYWRYLAYFVIFTALFSISIDLYARRVISRVIRLVEETKTYVLSFNEEIFTLVDNEMNSNPTIKDILGSPINVSKEAHIGSMMPIIDSKMTHRIFETSNAERLEDWKDAHRHQDRNHDHILGYSVTLHYLTAGIKNSGTAVVALKINKLTREIRMEAITLRLDLPSANNVIGIAIKTEDKLVPSSSK